MQNHGILAKNVAKRIILAKLQHLRKVTVFRDFHVYVIF